MSDNEKYSKIKVHFEEEALEYDEKILKIIPYYKKMVEILISSIPYSKMEQIRVLDIGCGTGEISRRIQERYPKVKLDCLDFSEKMLNKARERLGNGNQVEFVLSNVNELKYTDEFEVIVSGLALHHIKTDEEKIDVYRRIYRALKENGVFYNADLVLGGNKFINELNIRKWVEYMSRSFSREHIESEIIEVHRNEDSPAKLADHIRWLENVGFKNVDIIWKYYNLAVYGGYK
ncbi:MAG: class I SAM-dependent methyltransferase [Candidatus Helarchaeota archaeon]